MKNNILKKINTVAFIESLIKQYEFLVVICFAGVRSIELKGLRVFLNNNDIKLKVIKNSLFKKALMKTDNESIVKLMTGQNLFAFGPNVGRLALLLKNISKSNLNFRVVLGYSNGRSYLNKDVFNLVNVKDKFGEILNLLVTLKLVLGKFLRALVYNNIRLLFLFKSIKLTYKKE